MRCSTRRSSGRTSTARGRAGDEALGRSRGGLSTKIHAVVDALGNPVALRLTGGQASDLAGADALLPGIAAATVIADKGYDAEARVLGLPKEVRRDRLGVNAERGVRSAE